MSFIYQTIFILLKALFLSFLKQNIIYSDTPLPNSVVEVQIYCPTHWLHFVKTPFSQTAHLLRRYIKSHRYFVLSTYWFPDTISLFHLVATKLGMLPVTPFYRYKGFLLEIAFPVFTEVQSHSRSLSLTLTLCSSSSLVEYRVPF